MHDAGRRRTSANNAQKKILSLFIRLLSQLFLAYHVVRFRLSHRKRGKFSFNWWTNLRNAALLDRGIRNMYIFRLTANFWEGERLWAEPGS
jgi:hypothetical protein